MRLHILLLAVALCLAGCNYKPLLEPSEPTVSKELKSTHHWQQLAVDTANGLTVALSAAPDEIGGSHIVDGRPVPRTLAMRPIYLAGDRRSPFIAGFNSFLATELTRRGYFVATTPVNAVIVNTSTQVYTMADPDKPPFPPSLLAAPLGYYAVRMAEKTNLGPAGLAGAVIPAYVALDTVHWLAVAPNTEVVVTTSVEDEQRYLFRTGSIFYIGDAEAAAYQALPSAMVTNLQSAPPEVRPVYISAQ